MLVEFFLLTFHGTESPQVVAAMNLLPIYFSNDIG